MFFSCSAMDAETEKLDAETENYNRKIRLRVKFQNAMDGYEKLLGGAGTWRKTWVELFENDGEIPDYFTNLNEVDKTTLIRIFSTLDGFQKAFEVEVPKP